MAEDQGVNGTIWNKEATKLLSYFGWNTIGDYDMDVMGQDIGMSQRYINLSKRELQKAMESVWSETF